jgi:hypothetical protein
MNISAFLMDMAPLGGGIALFGGIAFFLVLAAAAFIAFLLLRKTLKMAFRLVIVAVILAVAIVGCISLFWLGSGKPNRPGPPRPTPIQPK